MTKPYAEVIGDPIVQSKSPAIHGFWIDQLGLAADYRACHVRPAELEEYLIRRRKDAQWRGCNVTMPHKQAVIPLLDGLDPLAARVGAVNTIVRGSDGLLRGFNTDVGGFLEPLRGYLKEPHLYRMARILGTGGAARAIVAALAGEGFTLVLAGRDPAKARALLDELAPTGEHHTPPLDHFAQATDFPFDDREGLLDLLVNASPLGMTGQPPLALDLSHVPPGAIVYDIVTSPARTPLLKAAAEAGFATVDGLAMLIGQAAEAFEKFFGTAPPRGADAELRARLAA
jgi:shikimate dehydrogenase